MSAAPHLSIVPDNDTDDTAKAHTFRQIPDGVIELGNPYATHLYGVMLGIGKRRSKITASWNQLAEASGMNRKTVQKTLDFLESAGFITTANRAANGRKISDVITLHNFRQVVREKGQSGLSVVHVADQPLVHETDHSGPCGGPMLVHETDHLTDTRYVTTDTEKEIPLNPPAADPDNEEEDVTFEERFNAFWAAYPKKRSKGDARKAFKAAKVDDALLARMVEALKQQRSSPQWTKSGGQFIPYPAGWIRDEAWEDVLEVDIDPSASERLVF